MDGYKHETFKTVSRVIIFLLLVVSLDYAGGKVMEAMYYRQKKGIYFRTTYGMEGTHAELLVFGSSSANHHYVPSIFSDSMKMTVFNEGRDGMEILYHTAVLKEILSRYTPKLVILNLTPNELSNVDNYDKLAALLPYCRKHPYVRDVLKIRTTYEKYKMYSGLYPFNSTFLTMLPNLKGHPDESQLTGYIPLPETMDTAGLHPITFRYEPILDSVRVKALDDFLSECRQRNIRTFVVYSPWYYATTDETATINATAREVNKYGSQLFNHILDTTFLGKPRYFKDESHLNSKGAALFSQIIVEQIRQNIKQK